MYPQLSRRRPRPLPGLFQGVGREQSLVGLGRVGRLSSQTPGRQHQPVQPGVHLAPQHRLDRSELGQRHIGPQVDVQRLVRPAQSRPARPTAWISAASRDLPPHPLRPRVAGAPTRRPGSCCCRPRPGTIGIRPPFAPHLVLALGDVVAEQRLGLSASPPRRGASGRPTTNSARTFSSALVPVTAPWWTSFSQGGTKQFSSIHSRVDL